MSSKEKKTKVLKKKLKKLKKLQAEINKLKAAIAPKKKLSKKKLAPKKPALTAPPAESILSPVRIAASRQN